MSVALLLSLILFVIVPAAYLVCDETCCPSLCRLCLQLLCLVDIVLQVNKIEHETFTLFGVLPSSALKAINTKAARERERAAEACDQSDDEGDSDGQLSDDEGKVSDAHPCGMAAQASMRTARGLCLIGLLH